MSRPWVRRELQRANAASPIGLELQLQAMGSLLRKPSGAAPQVQLLVAEEETAPPRAARGALPPSWLGEVESAAFEAAARAAAQPAVLTEARHRWARQRGHRA